MPTKQIQDFLKTLEAVKCQLQKHLAEGEGVKKDIQWLKDCYKDMRAIQIGLFVCALGAFLKYALSH